MTLPAEAVPDGAVFAPHHLTWGALVCLFVCAVVWDDHRHAEPVVAAAGMLLALFGFLFTWKLYPGLGAFLTLTGCLAATISLARSSLWWTKYPARPHIVAMAGAFVALDDAVSHAFGVWTPVDFLWRAFVYKLLV